VLRAWEKRYGVVSPGRTEGGLRLYSQDDVLRLQLLKRLTDQGHAIGQIAGLSASEMAELLRDEAIEDSIAGQQTEQTEAARFLAATLDAVQSLDGPRVYATLMRAVVALKSSEFIGEIVGPLLSRVGEMWSDRSICPVHEHILSVNLRRVLAWMIDSVPVDEDAPVLVCATPAHHRHELGAMLAGIIASEERWRVVYLGPDLPAEDIAMSAKLTGASVVALSLVYVRDKELVSGEVRKIRSRLSKSVMLVLGGEGTRNANMEKAGVMVLPDLQEFRQLLRSRDPRRDS
jgi:DNA-binding transcriptional MerR regulator/methylmalonyl-CoA mutase cobalamin-binding subunit